MLRTGRRLIHLGFILAWILLPVALAAQTSPPPATIITTTTLVIVPALIQSSAGGLFPALKASDFLTSSPTQSPPHPQTLFPASAPAAAP